MKYMFVLPLLLAACTSSPNRPAKSSYGCMVAVRDSLPGGLFDKRAHCLASALIAQQCSVAEAYLAGAGKEIRDMFVPDADAEWADWKADRVGIACAKIHHGFDDIGACCALSGY
jgi:hypothetical protein